MIFMDFARQPTTFWDVFAKWSSTLGMNKTGQFPFAVAWTKLFLSITGAPLTPFMIRLPSALWGILAILALYGCGRVLAGSAFALFLAAFFALNPFHIGISREAYFYPPMVCGSVLLIWAVFLQIKTVRDKNTLPGIFYFLLASGFFLTAYSQPSGWPFALMSISVILWMQAKKALREKYITRALIGIIFILAVIGIPLLLLDWALPQMISISSPEHKAYVSRIFGPGTEPVLSMLTRPLFLFGWGKTILRSLIAVVVILLSIIVTFRLWRRSAAVPVVIVLLAGNILLFAAARLVLIEQATSSRYLLTSLPLYIIWLALGIWFVPDLIRLSGKYNSRIGIAIASALIAVALSLNILPAYLATQLSGKPTPYWDIAHWCDSNLPPHSLVLVERWFDPWNELRIHNSTNVYFTFPVPSEPPDVFKQVNWPLHARRFMEKYPDAAYLEYFNSERQIKGLVTNWHFARMVSFTNEAAIKLAELGLAHREEFFDPHKNKLIVTIFYNTREDTIANARAAGNQYLVLYGPEWGYVKLWQQLRDFRDWRILEKEASLDIYNLTGLTNRVALNVRGMALNGSKRVVSSGKIHDFRHMQLEEWVLSDITFKPGINKIVLSDSLWSVSKVPALIDQVEIVPSP
jgi:hypothetical protein